MNGLDIQSSVMTDGHRMSSPWMAPNFGWSQPDPAFFVVMSGGWEGLTPKGRDRARAEMNRLGRWLLTPPNDRNENEVFFEDVWP
ncbi:hypothetical protein [Novosphingobium beihaiensis]|uniref:Uncharacterized protein n=1 Tax=Novosphingobium beihaiensis TaxID=2930389 RepID=A0ABT0BWH3_9SPHN|nr:hypothetical protein [Novosphingobium beihaiensis]MCJ2189243.1 hypothetical protein [Novosphingobium beihaiensis]